MNINNGHSPMSLINHRRRSARWHGASQKVGQLADPLFLDRIDIRLKIRPVPKNLLVDDSQAEPSSVIAERVAKAREIQLERFKGEHFFTNSEIPSPLVKKYCRLAESEKKYLMSVIEKMDISARRYNRILKLSRTIADLSGEMDIRTTHIIQAFHLSY